MAHSDSILEDRIVKLYADAGFPHDRMDIGITVMKMSDGQKQDMVAMIEWMEHRGDEACYIAGNVGHDLNGIKIELINGPCGFSPRSHGYAQQVS